jgi:hypothetical protein
MTRLQIWSKIEVGTVGKIEVVVFRFMTPCSLLGSYQRSPAIRCTRLQVNSSRDCMLAPNLTTHHTARGCKEVDHNMTFTVVKSSDIIQTKVSLY